MISSALSKSATASAHSSVTMLSVSRSTAPSIGDNTLAPAFTRAAPAVSAALHTDAESLAASLLCSDAPAQQLHPHLQQNNRLHVYTETLTVVLVAVLPCALCRLIKMLWGTTVDR